MPKLSTEVLVGDIRSESEIILCCARTRMDPETASRLQILLQKDIDWDSLIRSAALHGMMPCLYWNLNTICPEAVPKPILDVLHGYFQANTQRSLLLTGELLRLLDLLKAEGIAAIPLKGPAIATSVYGNLALRQFSDLDLLVHKQDLLRGKEIFLSQGYQMWIPMAGTQEASYLRSEHAYRFLGGEGQGDVELHWEIMPKYFAFPLDIERLWESLESVSLAGTTVKALRPEELLLFLCAHGAKHCWSRLDWICDVAELVRVHQQLNWEQVMEKARTLNSERRLFLGLFLARTLLGATLPREVSQKLDAVPTIEPLAKEVYKQFFHVNGTISKIREDLFQCRAMERGQDRIRYVWHRFWTPNNKDWTFLQLPAFLSFLYPLLRPIRLIQERGSRLFGRPFQDRD